MRGFATGHAGPIVTAVLCATLALGACSDDEPAGPTDEELLISIMEGDPTDAEVAAKLTTADLLCQLDPEILQAIWADLDRTQFEFQEFTFQHRCPQDDTFLLSLRNAKREATTTTSSTTTTTRRPTTTRRTTTSTTRPSTSTSTSSPLPKGLAGRERSR